MVCLNLNHLVFSLERTINHRGAEGDLAGRSYRALVASVTGPTPEERLISGSAQVERIEGLECDVWIAPFVYFVNRTYKKNWVFAFYKIRWKTEILLI
jgi:hypothetical protein